MLKSESIIFEKKLAYHTAPTLLGIKCASLISLSSDECDIVSNVETFNRKVASGNMQIKLLCEYKNRVIVLIYHKLLLNKCLNNKKIRQFLECYGYSSNMVLDEYLQMLSFRIMQQKQFPHEIGVFLGYPLDDVVGFIKNKGENCKMSGYWKVYSNTEQASRTFNNYKKCRRFLCNKLNKGYDIYQALKIS